ncbi:MAG: hypothetical protein KDA75_15615 [Planctomycetaceae bacterium]|mgnify:CR=1 FL=1|nr:hypothetical protein [Planctomycetaceae bacterium]
MLDSTRIPPRRLIRARNCLLILMLSLLWGCSEPDPIREYVVSKPPAPGSLWFFKLIGPEDSVAEISGPLQAFIESVQFNERSGLPEWSLPAGWTEETSANGVRFKTIKLPGDAGLEVAVTQIGARLPMSSAEVQAQAGILRDQVQAASAGTDGTGGTELSVGSRPGTWFDFQGETTRFGKTRLLAAMVPVPVAPSIGMPTAGGQLPFSYEAPPEWQAGQQTQFSVVSMTAGEGDATASMTVTRAMGGPLDNVNRWRGQAGLEAVEQAQLVDILEPIEAGELTILYTQAIGETRAILGAMVPMDEGTFFVKLDGPPTVVKDEQERFRKFLESFRAAE